MASGVLERVHLAVENRAPLLHTAIVTAADDASAVHQHRSDRDAALCPPFFRLLDGGAQKLIGHQWPRSYSSPRAKTDGASGSIAARSRGFDRQIRRSAAAPPPRIGDPIQTCAIRA